MGVPLKPDKKAPQVFGRKIQHIRQFGKVYGMRTIITIVKADYCLMFQLILNILSNVTLPPYPSFFVHFKHTLVTHPTKISRFYITVTPPPPPKKKNSECALSCRNIKWRLWRHTFELEMMSSKFLKFLKFSAHRIFLPSFSMIWLESEKKNEKFASLIMFSAKHAPINWLPWQQ